MTKFLLHILLLVGLLLVPALGWADFQAGVNAYERGDYETALAEFQALAEQGYADAQFFLGEMYAVCHEPLYRHPTELANCAAMSFSP